MNRTNKAVVIALMIGLGMILTNIAHGAEEGAFGIPLQAKIEDVISWSEKNNFTPVEHQLYRNSKSTAPKSKYNEKMERISFAYGGKTYLLIQNSFVDRFNQEFGVEMFGPTASGGIKPVCLPEVISEKVFNLQLEAPKGFEQIGVTHVFVFFSNDSNAGILKSFGTVTFFDGSHDALKLMNEKYGSNRIVSDLVDLGHGRKSLRTPNLVYGGNAKYFYEVKNEYEEIYNLLYELGFTNLDNSSFVVWRNNVLGMVVQNEQLGIISSNVRLLHFNKAMADEVIASHRAGRALCQQKVESNGNKTSQLLKQL